MHGKTCAEFGLKIPPANIPKDNEDVYNMTQERAEAYRLESSLNPEQKNVFQAIMDTIYIQQNSSNCFFLDGPGGSGKTYLYKTFLCAIRGKGDVVLPVASTGIAANLLIGGRTYHSQFKLPVPLTETSTSNMRENSMDAQIIRKAKLIIWDEATMALSHALNAVDKL